MTRPLVILVLEIAIRTRGLRPLRKQKGREGQNDGLGGLLKR